VLEFSAVVCLIEEVSSACKCRVL